MELDEQPIKRTGADEVTHEGLKVAENPNLVKYKHRCHEAIIRMM